MLALSVFIKALQAAGPLLGAIPELKQLFETAVTTLHTNDQPAAKAALELTSEKSDALHQTLQNDLTAVE